MSDFKDTIREALTTAAAKAGYIPKTLVVRNADKSVDGEIRISVSRGTDERDIIRAMQVLTIPDNTWFTVGTGYEEDIFPDNETRDKYRLRWGFREAVQGYDTSYVRGEMFARALDIADKMRDAYRRKASEVVVRLRYDPRTPATRHVKKAGLGPDRKGKVTKAKVKKRRKKSKARKVRRKIKRKTRR